jgi:hypothetical protein
MKHMLVLLAVCASLCAPAMATRCATGPNEDSLRPVLFAFRLGGFAGFGYNRHRTVQDVFPGGSECGRFVDGEGTDGTAASPPSFP